MPKYQGHRGNSVHVKPRSTSAFLLVLAAVVYWQTHSTSPHPDQPLDSRIHQHPRLHTHNDRLALHPDDKTWNTIDPSRSLEYHDCYGGYKCARILLPLHGNNSSDIAVAIIRRPARVNVTDSRYAGALIVNPGGPGASGIQYLLQDGERIQNIVDADTDRLNSSSTSLKSKFFDIISFDPRGVNHTVPQLNCFPNTFTRLVWSLSADAEGFIGSSSTAFDEKWSRYQSRSATCMERIEEQGKDSIGYYMGTRSVADDIMAIAERHGQWREAEARKLLDERRSPLDGLQLEQVLSNTKWRPGKEVLLFWGTSYGTLLGSTLATLYPQRIHRMILDTVASPHYYFNMSLDDTLVHSDEIFGQFGHLCHKYGPRNCKFYRDSKEAILKDIGVIASNLIASPLAVPATSYRGPESITHTDLKRLIAQTLYSPLDSFPMLAEYLQDLSVGNGTQFADYQARRKVVSVPDVQNELYHLSSECKKHGPYSMPCNRPNEWLGEVLLAISCGDGNTSGKISKDDFKAYWYAARNQSEWMGDMWTEWDLMCVGWEAKTKWKYDGPLAGNTSYPILMVGNLLDPVCPIENAYKLASGFPGAVVLGQNAIGHTILSSKSKCTEEAIREYFQTGQLPDEENICEVDREPFEKVEANTEMTETLRRLP